MSVVAPTGPDWWVSGRLGTLSPWSQSLVCAFSVVSNTRGLSLTDSEIAAQVSKVGGGHPTRNSIRVLRAKFEADVEWHPGKQDEEAGVPGRPKTITPQQQQALAKCAMTLKAKGIEPSAPQVIAHCPAASVNKDTGGVFTHKVILDVFKTRCFDSSPDAPWQQLCAKHKTALTPEMVANRLAWGETMLALKHHSGWYHRHCIWMDPCSSIIPGRPKSQFDQQQASYGKGKRWVSADSRDTSRNLRASPYAGKQVQRGDLKVWWFVVLAQGKVHVEVLGDKWKQNGEGQALMVSRLPHILASLLGDTAAKPDVVFTDRGPGFYHPSTGNICPEYLSALSAYGFRPWAGDQSKWQPPDIPDMLLHETVVAWLRKYLKHHPLKLVQDHDTNKQRLASLLSEAASYINTWYEVEQLSMSLPRRLWELVHVTEGDRLKY